MKRFIIFMIIVSVALLVIPRLVYADLTPTDDATLTSDFETLSVSWAQSAVDSATSILCKADETGQPVYKATDWENWFNKFFNTDNHSYTDPLADYLGYPVFSWCDDNMHRNLQMGLTNPLWAKISNITSAHPVDIGMAMFNNASLRQSLFNAHRFFAFLAEKGTVDVTIRTNVYINYKNYILTYLQYFSDATLIDKFSQPFVSLLRAQVWINFGQTLPLDASRKGEIATTISIGRMIPKKLDIWNDFTVLVIDNNGLDSSQLNLIYDLLNGIPVGLQNLRYITVRDFFSLPLWRVILNKGDTINYNLALRRENTAQFSFQDTKGQIEEFQSQTPLVPDKWNHLAVTFDGNNVTMYINGLLDGTYAARGLPNTVSSKPLELGRRIIQNQVWRGKLDEVKIYGRALSAAEIDDEYKNQSVSTAKLVAYYRMDEPDGTFVDDSSDFGNNGTNVGATIMPGKVYNGLFFNGKDNYVEIPDNPSLRLDGPMTLETWVYFVNEEERWNVLGGAGAVNISGVKVGAITENPFPSDISPVYVDTFSEIAAHEFNHVVDGFYVIGDATLKSRREQLMTQARSSALQYLRSMVVYPDGKSAFPQNSQEFFASISNQYFTDSWHTFDLAIQRFDKGYKEPINQFLFFADIYSKGGLTTKIYRFNTKGILTVDDAPIYRDFYGHITEITRASKNTIYRFKLDINGNVTAYTMVPLTSP